MFRNLVNHDIAKYCITSKLWVADKFEELDNALNVTDFDESNSEFTPRHLLQIRDAIEVCDRTHLSMYCSVAARFNLCGTVRSLFTRDWFVSMRDLFVITPY